MKFQHDVFDVQELSREHLSYSCVPESAVSFAFSECSWWETLEEAEKQALELSKKYDKNFFVVKEISAFLMNRTKRIKDE